MDIARTFVSFSSTDKYLYHLMTAWKANENIDFNFADFQLEEAINSGSPYYIKSVCAAKIRRADTFVLLIGNDTYTKTEFVQAEVEAAFEKGCRLIGVNLNDCRFPGWLCPWFFMNKGALYVPYSPHVIGQVLKPWKRPPPDSNLTSGDWYFYDSVYTGPRLHPGPNDCYVANDDHIRLPDEQRKAVAPIALRPVERLQLRYARDPSLAPAKWTIGKEPTRWVPRSPSC
jgi:MTH538 TIR-like domain (DUF1863)